MQLKLVSRILYFRCDSDEIRMESMIHDLKDEATKCFGDEFIEDIGSDNSFECVYQMEHLAIEFLEYNIASLPSKW